MASTCKSVSWPSVAVMTYKCNLVPGNLINEQHGDMLYIQVHSRTLNHSKKHYLALEASLLSPAEKSEMLGGCQDRVSWQY